MGLLGLGRLARGLSTAARIGAQVGRHMNGGNGYFNPEDWESNYPEILDDATYKYGNPGQDVILNEYWLPAAEDFCQDYDNYEDGFNKDKFIDHIANEIGDEKYNAVSEITDEAANELEQVYSDAGGKTSSFALNYTLTGAITAAVMAKSAGDVKLSDGKYNFVLPKGIDYSLSGTTTEFRSGTGRFGSQYTAEIQRDNKTGRVVNARHTLKYPNGDSTRNISVSGSVATVVTKGRIKNHDGTYRSYTRVKRVSQTI